MFHYTGEVKFECTEGVIKEWAQHRLERLGLTIPEAVPKLERVVELLTNQTQYLQPDSVHRGGLSSKFQLCLKFCTGNCRIGH